MSGSQYQQNQGNDALMSIAFLGLLVAGVSFFAWYKFHTQITIGVFAVLHEELQLASLWSGSYRAMSAALAANDPSMIKIGQLLNAVGVVSRIYRFPAATFLVALGAVCVVRASGERYTEKLDLDRLMKVQSQVFPFISAYLNRPLSLVAPDLLQPRPGDPALHLGEWIWIHALSANGTYDATKARNSLIAHLGSLWTGVGNAPPAAKAMFAVFALHAARERDEAAALLGTLSKSLTVDQGAITRSEHGNARTNDVIKDEGEVEAERTTESAGEGPEGPTKPLVFSEQAMRAVEAVLANSDVIAPSVEIASQHAFTTTALMGLLMHARKRAGVLAPGQFAFLKMVDRSLWYALHSLGFPLTAKEDGPMPNARIEALGARAHWEAERCAGGALTVPKIETAEAAIKDRIAHSQNSKRQLLEVR